MACVTQLHFSFAQVDHQNSRVKIRFSSLPYLPPLCIHAKFIQSCNKIQHPKHLPKEQNLSLPEERVCKMATKDRKFLKKWGQSSILLKCPIRTKIWRFMTFFRPLFFDIIHEIIPRAIAIQQFDRDSIVYVPKNYRTDLEMRISARPLRLFL